MTWIDLPADTDFPLENLPFGVIRPPGGEPRVATRIGDHVVDLAAAQILPELTAQPALNPLMASGRGREVRKRAGELLSGPARPDVVHALGEVDVLLPVAVGDFVDFMASLHHCSNMGAIIHGGTELPPNFRHLPPGYTSRAGTVVVSGTPVTRPWGVTPDPDDGMPRFTPTRALDLELEVGFLVGGPTATRIQPDDAGQHVFGVVLLNDWSARDIQGFEMAPLGPHLSKSFATTISPWVVTLDALSPYLVDPVTQDPEPEPFLRASRPWALDLELSVELNGTTISRNNFRDMYWTFAQLLAHMTANGATARPGDLFASGTVSGPTKGERGCLMELTWRGAEPVELADGSRRVFLADGDTVTLRGHCGGGGRPRIGFGEATGVVLAG